MSTTPTVRARLASRRFLRPDGMLAGVGEFELIARIAPLLDGGGGPVVVGYGDDAAVLAPSVGAELVVAVDVVVEGVHFRRDLSRWQDVGWKAVAVNVSDLAAMAATPLAAVAGLCRPPDLDEAAVVALYEGMRAAGARWGMRLVGGDTVGGPGLVVSVTALGEVARGKAVTRSGARPGDRLVAVGALGAAAAAMAQDAAGAVPEAALLAAHRRPRAYAEAGRILGEHGATAMIDVSDGLGADLGHLCEASDVGVRLSAAALPVAAGALAVLGWEGVCGGGEDFTLLAALPPERAEAAAAAAGAAECVPAAVVGEVVAFTGPPQVLLELPDGRRLALDGMGYEHFAGANRAPSPGGVG